MPPCVDTLLEGCVLWLPLPAACSALAVEVKGASEAAVAAAAGWLLAAPSPAACCCGLEGVGGLYSDRLGGDGSQCWGAQAIQWLPTKARRLGSSSGSAGDPAGKARREEGDGCGH